MKKSDLETLAKITGMQSDLALAQLAAISDEMAKTRDRQAANRCAVLQAWQATRADPALGSGAVRFSQWAGQEAAALQRQADDQGRLLETRKAEAIRAFGRKMALDSLRAALSRG